MKRLQNVRHGVINKTQELVSLAKKGDGAAREQLCAVYGERLRRILRLRMGKELRSKLESMDLVQDALISALKGLGDFTYESEGDFLRWLSTIAENRLRDNVDRLHACRRDIRKESPLGIQPPRANSGPVGAPGPVDTATPSAILSGREDLDKLEKAMDELKHEYREVIVLTKIDGLSYVEAGSRLGKSPDAVRMLACRAMAALTSAFEQV